MNGKFKDLFAPTIVLLVICLVATALLTGTYQVTKPIICLLYTSFLSSFTTKVAVYCLIRMFAGTSFLIWFGVAMALYGALFAIMENDVRRLLSYHIISQVGFMVAFLYRLPPP